jgi:fluoroquinolone transport system permease protein
VRRPGPHVKRPGPRAIGFVRAAIPRGAVPLLVRHDLRLQVRNRFHLAYAFVAIVYVVLVRALPADLRIIALPPLLLSEAGAIGCVLAGAFLHFERSDGTLHALAVTPLSAGRYMLGRALALALLIAAVATVIALGGMGPAGFLRTALIAATALATGVLCVSVGTVIALRSATLDGFAVAAGLSSTALALPVLPFLGAFESPLWWVHPLQPALLVFSAGAGAGGGGSLRALPALLLLVAWAALAVMWATGHVARHGFGRGTGGS